MSSDEDEFFDAPNAFVSSLSKWNESNEDLSMNTLEIVSKNAERRNRVESLRRNISNTVTQTLETKDSNPTKEELHPTTKLHVPIDVQQPSCEKDTHRNQSLIEAVLYQQKLIQQLKKDTTLCQCMRNLLNTISTAPITINDEKTLHNELIQQNLSTQVTKSCPECCKPVHSLDVTLGLQNALNSIKSWSLDVPRSSHTDKNFYNQPYRTMPTDVISNKITTVDTNAYATIDCNQRMCPNCQYINDSSTMSPSRQKKSFSIHTPQYCHHTEPSYSLQPSDELNVVSNHHHHRIYLDNPNNTTSSPPNYSGGGGGPTSNPVVVSSLNDSSSQLLHTAQQTHTLTATPGIAQQQSAQNTVTTTGMIPPEMNPIEIQFRERTKSMEKMLKESRNSSLQKSEESDRLRETGDFSQRAFQSFGGKVKRLHKNVKNAWSAVSRAKIFSQDEELSSEDEEFVGNRGIRLRSSRRMKGQRDFLQIKLVQEMKDEHTGAIWAMRFSPCGRLLATAGYDRAIRVWVLRQYYWFFKQYQRNAYSSAADKSSTQTDCDFDMARQTMMTEEELAGVSGVDSVSLASTSISAGKTDGCGSTCSSGDDDIEQGRRTPFRSRPLIIYRGHEGVVTDLVWSKNLFLLATSMDRQVRLWHISRRECLCIFNHNDTVPTIVFHPKDDRYFLSGSLDGKLRLWNIPDKKIRHWVEAQLPNSLPLSSVFFSTFSTPSNNTSSTSNTTTNEAQSNTLQATKTGAALYSTTNASSNTTSTSGITMAPPPKTVITCAAFVCEATKIAVGTYDGRVLFYTTELEYITSMAIKSTHGKNKHCRVTAIEIDPTDSHKILVTSNDSRVRLIDARDYHINCKYRGFTNFSSQIRASFSPTGKYVISGSENHFFYIWKKDVEINRMTRFSTTRKDRNNYWEAIKAQDTVVSVCLFSPAPHLVLDRKYRRRHSVGPSSHHVSKETPEHQTAGSDIGGLVVPTSCSANIANQSNIMDPSNNPSNSFIYQSPYLGEVIVSADINGVIKVFKNRIHSLPVSANNK